MIYMDNAATTRLSGMALEAMMPYLTEQYANPAGTYSFTHASNAAMEKARKQVADVIGATSAEIFFTSGGTESDNWALKGTMHANEKKGRHLIISAIEHHAILHTCQWLEAQGWRVTYLPVDNAYASYDLSAVSEIVQDASGDVSVVCRLTNSTDMDAYNPTVALGLYTDDGTMVYADGTTLQDVGIPAGGTVLVRFDVDDVFVKQWQSYGAMPTQANTNASFRKDED